MCRLKEALCSVQCASSRCPPACLRHFHTLRCLLLTASQTCEGDQLRQLVHSLCPSIFGHELVKASHA